MRGASQFLPFCEKCGEARSTSSSNRNFNFDYCTFCKGMETFCAKGSGSACAANPLLKKALAPTQDGYFYLGNNERVTSATHSIVFQERNKEKCNLLAQRLRDKFGRSPMLVPMLASVRSIALHSSSVVQGRPRSPLYISIGAFTDEDQAMRAALQLPKEQESQAGIFCHRYTTKIINPEIGEIDLVDFALIIIGDSESDIDRLMDHLFEHVLIGNSPHIAPNFQYTL